jgi:site-specific recombinase XerD
MEESWRSILAAVLRDHNHLHSRTDRKASNLTIQQRGDRLFHCFEQLHGLGYRLEDPRHIAERHVQALVDLWVAQKHSAATIQTKLSHLRLFAGWIGKAGLVQGATDYVSDPALVKRTYAAQTDASWTSKNIDPGAMTRHLRSFDPYVANQQLAQLHFGLRVKESVMLRPWRADGGDVLLIDDGAKGGRPRAIPLESQAQREALSYLKAQVRTRDDSLADPSRTLKQAMTRYYVVMRAAGITRKKLGITSHGLRKEFANRTYYERTGVKSPVQGGPPIDRAVDREARLRLVARLGHSRESVGAAYLGAPLGRRRKGTDIGSPQQHGPHSAEDAEPA